MSTSASCGSRGWTGTDCLCALGEVAQGDGSCFRPAAPVSCPSPYEGLYITTAFPQGICLPSDVDFNNPDNAYLGQLISGPPPHRVTNPIALITSVYGSLTPGVAGTGVTYLTGPSIPPIQTPSGGSNAPTPTGLELSGRAQNKTSPEATLQQGTVPGITGTCPAGSVWECPPGPGDVIACGCRGLGQPIRTLLSDTGCPPGNIPALGACHSALAVIGIGAFVLWLIFK